MNARVQQHAGLCAGLPDPVHDAQLAFRQALDALARPGRPVALGKPIRGLPVGGAMAHLLLALTDAETPVWWQQADAAQADWLRFHTGAGTASAPAQASFAVIDDALRMPPLADFSTGSAASPEHSATLLVEVPSLDAGPALEWRGPGIQDQQTVRLAGLGEDFWLHWQANHALFPQGVDILLTCGDLALGLPRTTRVRRLEGI